MIREKYIRSGRRHRHERKEMGRHREGGKLPELRSHLGMLEKPSLGTPRKQKILGTSKDWSPNMETSD